MFREFLGSAMLPNRWIDPVLALPRRVKRGCAYALDAALCVLTVWIAFSLRTGDWVQLSGYGWPAALASIVLALPIFMAFGVYKSVFRWVGWDALLAMAQAVILYGVIYASVFTAFAVPGVPRTIGVIQPILLLIAMIGTRATVSYWLGGRYRNRRRRSFAKNVLIYGAGSAGRQLATALADTIETRLVGFIDDAQNLQGSFIERIPVFGPHHLAEAIEDHAVSEIYLAIPSATQARRNQVLNMVRSLGVGVRTLPGLLDIAQGRVTTSHLRPLDIEDLLGRDPVAPDLALLERDIRGRTVLVTGAGGSIGSELCRQIITMRPRRLLLVEAAEFALYEIDRELKRLNLENETELVPLLASVADDERVRSIFAAWHPETVYHAAAYKHVPLVEHNLIEGVRNNVFGTLICAMAAREFRAKRFVLVSTDKAVRPTNVMGTSKRLSEMVLQALAAEGSATCFAMVRFGNVLGSSGSVVPLFRQQIAAGGPVTVTHPEITRYFMTISEAAQLVLQAGAMATGGEVFVLDMREPVRIADLAIKMIELSGLRVRNERNPDGDIEIAFTGMRPGEKLYEELLIGGSPLATGHPRILVASEHFIPSAQLMPLLDSLADRLSRQQVLAVREALIDLVPEYCPGEVVDFVGAREAQGTQVSRLSLVNEKGFEASSSIPV